jgi:hypothetical protein
MRQMSKLFLNSLVKMLLIFLPAALVVFYGCYLLMEMMIAHGMQQYAYVLALLSAEFLYYIARRLIARDLKRMAELRKSGNKA